jgi:hypothetical protein
MFTMRIQHIMYVYHEDPAHTLCLPCTFIHALVLRKKIIVVFEYLKGLGHRIGFKYLDKHKNIEVSTRTVTGFLTFKMLL